jgi:hypothetical protein
VVIIEQRTSPSIRTVFSHESRMADMIVNW